MDPNKALDELREMVSDILGDNHHSATTVRFAERFDALDEWLSKDGFLPRSWE